MEKIEDENVSTKQGGRREGEYNILFLSLKMGEGRSGGANGRCFMYNEAYTLLHNGR